MFNRTMKIFGIIMLLSLYSYAHKIESRCGNHHSVGKHIVGYLFYYGDRIEGHHTYHRRHYRKHRRATHRRYKKIRYRHRHETRQSRRNGIRYHRH